MKVTLKRASALALALSAVIDKTVIPSALTINPFSDAPSQDTIDEAYSTFHLSVGGLLNAIEAKFQIRMLVSQANEGEINRLLNYRADVEAKLKALATVPNRVRGSGLIAIEREILSKREASPTAGMALRGNNVTFELETESFLSGLIKPLTKEKREIDDKLQQLNFSTEITLPEEVVAVLTSLDLV